MKGMIHWFGLPCNTHVNLTDSCIKYLIKRRKFLKLTQVQISRLLNMSEGGFRYWETRKRSPSVKMLICWLKVLKLQILFVEDKINFVYQLGGNSSITIYNPNFPFKEIPEHAALIAHGFFDGCLKNTETGGLVYETPNLTEQKMFRNLIKSCKFGKFKIPINSKGYSTLPAPLSQLLQKHYKINSFLSNEAFFSKKLMQLTKYEKWRKLIIRAAFIDEGSSGKTKPRDNVEIVAVSNKLLALQIFKLCKLQNYDISFHIDKKINLYSVYLKADSTLKFYNDIAKSMLSYYKKYFVKVLVKRNLRVKNQIEKVKKYTNENKEIRVMDIQNILNITESSARRRINRLMREGYIEKINNKYLLRRQI